VREFWCPPPLKPKRNHGKIINKEINKKIEKKNLEEILEALSPLPNCCRPLKA
jgi:hypothetical protein